MVHKNSTLSLEEQQLRGKTESYRHKVYSLLITSGIAMTDRQMMEMLNEDDVNNIRPEITRLKQDGILRECGLKVCSRTGKLVRLVEVTDKPYFSRGNKRIPTGV